MISDKKIFHDNLYDRILDLCSLKVLIFLILKNTDDAVG